MDVSVTDEYEEIKHEISFNEIKVEEHIIEDYEIKSNKYFDNVVYVKEEIPDEDYTMSEINPLSEQKMDTIHSYGSKRPTCQNTREIIIDGGSDTEIIECEDIYDEIADRLTDMPDASDDGEDPEPFIELNQRRIGKPIWRKARGGIQSKTEAPEWLGQHPNDDGIGTEIRNPIAYFRHFFTDEILENIILQSNLYATQNNPNKPLGLTKNELEQFMGSLMWMSIIKLSNIRLYWKGSMANLLVAKIFSRDRWETIKSNLHFNDNNDMPERNSQDFDKLYKIRPLVSSLKEKFRAIPMTSRLCVDEQMVPFKGHSSLKQYIPSKPHKWGYKLFVLSDVHGIVYDFEVYTGNILPVSNRPDLGASSNIVIQLAECIPDGFNYQLFLDNWFTSIPLIVHLAKRQIYAIGTIRANRLPGADLIKDKDLQAKGRGTHEEKETTIDGVRIRVVKWHDSRAVNLVSTFASAEPLTECQRYDKNRKEFVTLSKPNIVDTYNSFMGGVDLLDHLISLYRIHVRSKKFYHKFFFHFIDLAVVNSWLLYRRDCDKYSVPLKSRHNLQEFKMNISESLLMELKTGATPSRGWPSTSNTDRDFAKKIKLGHATKPIPNQSVRTDGYHHFPEFGVRQRCKNPGCTAKPVFKCSKCDVHLCITSNKNCFKQFHSA